jgi:hypothetical protein
MLYTLLQKVRILKSAEEYSDFHGEMGVVVMMRQLPTDPMPYISLKMSSGELIEDLLPGDIEPCISKV